jgi:hypothetical protein
MCSSGIRLGAWDYLRWNHITAITNENNEVIAAKITVYGGDVEEYYSFITPEAYYSLKNWMDFRASHGEKINNNSWLMRDLWKTTNVNYGAKWGLAEYPKRLKSTGIKRIIERALWEQGLRTQLTDGKKRHEWKAAHGFRKFFKTRTEQIMRPINVEITMGHNTGVSQCYYKPTEKEVLEDYLRAVDLLSISNVNRKLEKQISDLKAKNEENEYIIRGELEEKDRQIKSLMKKQENFEKLVQSLIDNGQLKQSELS